MSSILDMRFEFLSTNVEFFNAYNFVAFIEGVNLFMARQSHYLLTWDNRFAWIIEHIFFERCDSLHDLFV